MERRSRLLPDRYRGTAPSDMPLRRMNRVNHIGQNAFVGAHRAYRTWHQRFKFRKTTLQHGLADRAGNACRPWSRTVPPVSERVEGDVVRLDFRSVLKDPKVSAFGIDNHSSLALGDGRHDYARNVNSMSSLSAGVYAAQASS